MNREQYIPQKKKRKKDELKVEYYDSQGAKKIEAVLLEFLILL